MLRDLGFIIDSMRSTASEEGVRINLSDDRLAGLILHMEEIGFETQEYIAFLFHILMTRNSQSEKLFNSMKLIKLPTKDTEGGEEDDGPGK